MRDIATQRLIQDLWDQHLGGCTTRARCCHVCIVEELVIRVGREKAERLADCIEAVRIAETAVLNVSSENRA